jgi:hypothetical protein
MKCRVVGPEELTRNTGLFIRLMKTIRFAPLLLVGNIIDSSAKQKPVPPAEEERAEHTQNVNLNS